MRKKREPDTYGAICCPGGRTIEVTSKHLAWVEWAQNALKAAAQKEADERQRPRKPIAEDTVVKPDDALYAFIAYSFGRMTEDQALAYDNRNPDHRKGRPTITIKGE